MKLDRGSPCLVCVCVSNILQEEGLTRSHKLPNYSNHAERKKKRTDEKECGKEKSRWWHRSGPPAKATGHSFLHRLNEKVLKMNYGVCVVSGLFGN